jgi:hypothetical protein
MTRLSRAATTAALSTVAALTLAAGASALPVQLPPTAQVNDDPANSIFPDQPAGASDVVGGSLAAGGVNVPWAAFEQKTDRTTAQQIFVRAFKNGQWTTQGFPASLNIDTNQKAEAPSIDFAGAGRTVPWVSWYEPSVHLGGAKNVFASRFDAATKTWIPDGQDRSAGLKLPSLNIHTNRDAEDPSVAGGAAVPGNDPVPWVAWQEVDGAGGKDQIFVSRAAKDADVHCASLGKFCWIPTGVQRLDSGQGTTDPSLDVDVKRDGIEPDIAFTGPSDKVPWVVWYETGAGTTGLAANDQVFAAKAVPDPTGAHGGFTWTVVGNGGSAPLDAGAGCAASHDAENACSLNAVPAHDAEDPRVAAGSLTPGGTTSPWVVWSEDTGSGKHAIFVSRLVGGTFQLFNNGQPISNTVNDSTNPDIAFSGNEPYVSWQEDVAGVKKTFLGHFEGGATAPVFKLDTPTGLPAAAAGNLRAPVSSSCTANPFTADGVACPGGAAGTPFALQTTADARLLAHGYGQGAVVTGDATAITASSAHVAATADPQGAAINAHVEFGTTTAYGSRTADVKLGPNTGADAFAADLSGLPAGTLIHYRAVASTDFGTVAGADRTLVTGSPAPTPTPAPAPHRHLSIGSGTLKLAHGAVKVKLSCPAGAACAGTVKLLSHRTVLGSARFAVAGGHRRTVTVHLNRKALARLRRAHRLSVRISAGGRTRAAVIRH